MKHHQRLLLVPYFGDVQTCLEILIGSLRRSPWSLKKKLLDNLSEGYSRAKNHWTCWLYANECTQICFRLLLVQFCLRVNFLICSWISWVIHVYGSCLVRVFWFCSSLYMIQTWICTYKLLHWYIHVLMYLCIYQLICSLLVCLFILIPHCRCCSKGWWASQSSPESWWSRRPPALSSPAKGAPFS